ncbi:class I SAM-dependent methyltransferase [Candidatus Leptofilum sp.]|uniref:class I SAM-dependent methyltransferase n=1 Tax=Candidatus Leptofilum sp. TaxID=3241576 RepID=UPI003B5C85F0
MNSKDPFRDSDYLQKNQYKDSSNLDARAELHRRFSTAKVRWQPWVFDLVPLEPGMRVLECGCGPGWLWRESVTRLPADCHITLTDLSPGMVAEAEAALAESAHQFAFQPANIQALEFADEAFDVVVANHMLYHVPDLAQGLAEVRRVLKPNGRFIAATNGDEHMKELPLLIPDEVRQRVASWRMRRNAKQLPFRLENGRQLLEPYFAHVKLHEYDDSLWVTDADLLVAYAFSMIRPEMDVPETAVTQIRDLWAAKIVADGGIHISKHSGVFEAYK